MTEVGELNLSEPNPYERLLTVSVDAPAMEAARARAARRLSREVKVKGFRPGKAPQRLVEAVVGAETMRREAIDEALPQAVTSAVKEAGLEPAVSPRVTAVRDSEGGLEADVRVTLWPEVAELPAYRGRRIVVASPAVWQARDARNRASSCG